MRSRPSSRRSSFGAASGIESNLTAANYRQLAEGCLKIYARSLGYAASTTLLCLLIGFPMALAIARAPESWRALLLFLVVLPFWTSFLIRVYAWIALLQPSGLINRALLHAGLIDAADAAALQRFFGTARAGLFVSAVHDPAALRQPVAARREPRRSRRRSRRPALAHPVLA